MRLADESDLQRFAKELAEALIVKVCGVLGEDEGGVSETILVNRTVRYGQTMNGWPFLGCEVDPRHVEIITETLGLRRADGTKTMRSPGTKRSVDEVNNARFE